MDADSQQSLVRFLKREAGDNLRGVAAYQSTDYKVLYLRNDVQAKRFEDEVDEIIDRLRQESRVREQQAFPFDGLNGTVRSFSDAMVMHFPRTQERGTVITFDPEVARQLNTFMQRCLERIKE
jgi:hypothetical protein